MEIVEDEIKSFTQEYSNQSIRIFDIPLIGGLTEIYLFIIIIQHGRKRR